MALDIVFMGTPAFSRSLLESLIEADIGTVKGVFTRPASVSGRGRARHPSPVASYAAERGIPVFTPSSLADTAVTGQVAALAPDVIVVAAYGLLLPDALLHIPVFGCINVHASLLPRWRGAAPVERAILAGDDTTGVSIMRLVHELDAGAYAQQRSVRIGENNAMQVTEELARIGADALLDVLAALEDGTVSWTQQDASKVTYAEKVEKAEMLLDPALDATENLLRVRASTDQAPARAMICGRGCTVLDARIDRDAPVLSDEQLAHGHAGRTGTGDLPPTGSAFLANKRLVLSCAQGGRLVPVTVKPDGKRAMDASAFVAGIHRALDDPTMARWGRI